MEEVAVVGVDLAKSVFQVHGIDARGQVVLRRKLGRSKLIPFFAKLPACVVGMETCASANYWSRELIALGHEVRLMPPQYVKPYVKRSKNDASDAEAICEAVTRPTMRFVGVKSPEQQSVLVLHRTRLILTRQRTQIANAVRAHLAEFGIVASVGRLGFDRLVGVIADENDQRVPAVVRTCLAMLVAQYRLVLTNLLETDRGIRAHSRASELGRRLQEIPGVGPLVASALVATVPDPRTFKNGRGLSAWLGLVPRQNSSGGKERLGGITKAGDTYLRKMLFVGAMAVIRHAERYGTRKPWLLKLLGRRHPRIAAIALANRIGRIAWVLMTSGERYREPAVA
ncbi:MAG TPA: IS110 family transposase [Xanthobacteraceae bacterium]|nr:IS110 family transposase [Xanthobacteraceae bacterium]